MKPSLVCFIETHFFESCTERKEDGIPKQCRCWASVNSQNIWAFWAWLPLLYFFFLHDLFCCHLHNRLRITLWHQSSPKGAWRDDRLRERESEVSTKVKPVRVDQVRMSQKRGVLFLCVKSALRKGGYHLRNRAKCYKCNAKTSFVETMLWWRNNIFCERAWVHNSGSGLAYGRGL